MKLTFLGTAAAEMYPGIFCACPNCQAAREAGGKNIRGNSAAMLDGDILLDMNATSLYTAARLGLSMAGIRHVLVTHAHADHFTPERLKWRRAPLSGPPPFDPQSGEWSARYTPLPLLTVHGNRHTREAFDAVFEDGALLAKARHDLAFSLIREGEAYDCGDFTFVPVRANHGKAPGYAHSYIITRGGKTLFYALDSGGYDPDQLAVLAAHRYDCVVMEGTFGLGHRDEPAEGAEPMDWLTGKGHMTLKKDVALRDWLRAQGCLKEGAVCVLSHMCPHYCPPHDEYVDIAAQEGFLVAYDGMTVEV